MPTLSWTDVANSALLRLGTQFIVSLDSNNVSARLCKMRLPLVVPKVLRMYPWKSAMKGQMLAALSTPPADPSWGFVYPLPTDIVRIWQYMPGSPSAGINYGTNFVIRSGTIWTNDGPSTSAPNTPFLLYVQNMWQTNTLGPAPLDALLIDAIALQLAQDICYQVTQSIPLKQDIGQECKAAIQKAKSIDSMESPEVFDWEASEFLTARFAGTGYMGPNNPGFPTAQ